MRDNYLIYLKPGAVNWDNYLPVLINLKKNNLDVYLDDLNILSQFDINNNSHNFFKIINRYYIKIDEKSITYLKKKLSNYISLSKVLIQEKIYLNRFI